MRRPPDFFELRLDALLPHLDEIENALGKFRAPSIITARHPREGGMNALCAGQRRELLLRFVPHAAYVDIELRSATPLKSVIAAARKAHVPLIVSMHDFRRTPSRAQLQKSVRAAHKLRADILKIATRVDRPAELSRLLESFALAAREQRVAAMGIGTLGRASRLLCAQRGSALNYCHLGEPAAEGQLSVTQFRTLLRSLPVAV